MPNYLNLKVKAQAINFEVQIVSEEMYFWASEVTSNWIRSAQVQVTMTTSDI